MNGVNLETSRLLLRRFETGDLEDLYEYACRPEVGPAAGWKPHESRRETEQILTGFIHGTEVWAVVLKETGKVIGSVGLHGDSHRSSSPEVKMLRPAGDFLRL